MKISALAPAFLYSIAFMAFSGCKKESTPATDAASDTRIWVQEAYAKIDVMKLTPAFTEKRAEIIKAKMDQEKNPSAKINLTLDYAFELLKQGRTDEAIQIYVTLDRFFQEKQVKLDPKAKRNLYSLMGIAYMRKGEVENCVRNHNHESCFIPIKGQGLHQAQEGSTRAIEVYQRCLDEFPEDLESRYLLNIAYMTLGKYPNEVPAKYLIDPSWFKSKHSIPAFKDIASDLGVNRQGLAGGVVVDDFDNDGWQDIVVTSWSPTEELVFYKNNGDGAFSDQTEAFGLKGHVGILNLNQTDFNNDGYLDLYLMRGAWYMTMGDIPNTLLMNTGKGSFVDVTLKAGLTHVAPTQASAWADYNLDGWLDLVVGNESLPNFDRGIDLYINNQDGTFTHSSVAYGLTQNHFFKGVVASDVNNDRYPDLYFSALASDNLLFVNQGAKGQNTFSLAGPETKVNDPKWSFPCWSFDFNNDGQEDLFVSSYNNDASPVGYWMESHMKKMEPGLLPKLYKNNGNMTFDEVGVQMGLTETAFTMGCNFGDINTDGYLDFYLSTGNPLYQGLVPNKMYLNMQGERFEDVSYSGHFANIQKGHGVGFADWDHDGDEDIYVVIGGAYDGDGFYNCLFENPNYEQNHWVVLNLSGTTANKKAVGARVAISVQDGGRERMIYRTVTSGASFGGNSLALEVGLGKATSINSVKVQWPCRDCKDEVFTDLEIDKAYALVQDSGAPKMLEYKAVKPGPMKGMDMHMHH